MTETFVKVASVSEIPEGHARVFEVGDLEIALCNVGGTFHAIENICSHDGGPLGEGRLVGAAIECPRHGARFDVTTGAVLRMPAVVGVRAFPTKVSEGFVYIGVEEGDL